MIYELFSSLRIAGRSLCKDLLLNSMVLLVLAVGIGANIFFFTINYNVLLRPLDYPDSERLVRLWPDRDVNKLVVATIAEHGRSFESVSPYQGTVLTLNGEHQPLIIKGARVGVEFFRVLKVSPVLGRTFNLAERQPGRRRVAVLSHSLWRRVYGGDPDILERVILIDGEPHQVIGVMPASFRSLEHGWDLWQPLTIDPSDEADFKGSFYLKFIARLNPGTAARQAETELRSLSENLHATFPNLITEEMIAAASVVPLQENLVKSVRPILLVLMGAVGLVLLIVCGSAAILFLARALKHHGDLAIRAALGAGRGRLVRLVVTESLLLGMIAGLFGLVSAFFSLKLALTGLIIDLPRSEEVTIDAPVVIFGILLSILVALVFSLWPARRAMGFALLSDLRLEGGVSVSPESRRFGRSLVTLQVAMAMVLMLSAGFFLESLWRLKSVDPGFSPANVFTFRIDLPAPWYPENSDVVEYFRRIQEQIEALNGVKSVGAIHLLPLTADNWSFPYLAEDQPAPVGAPLDTALPQANFRVVTPGYFETLGIRVREGRTFRKGDDGGAPAVGVINRTLAELLWPGGVAVGKKIHHFGAGGPSFEVIGIVEDVHQHRLDEKPKPEIYRPYAQWPRRSMYLMVYSTLPPATLVPSLRDSIAKVDSKIPLADMRPLEDVLRVSTAIESSASFIVSAFAGFSMLLAMVSLYGIISFRVQQRTHEIAIRMAVGAQRRHVLQSILGEGLRITASGLVLGCVVAAPCIYFLRDRLYQTSVSDPKMLFLVAAVITISTLGSIWIPAWRATRTQLPLR
jgi:putative ABC transport system permease protein